MWLFYVLLLAGAALFMTVGYYSSERYKIRKSLAGAQRIPISSLREGALAKVVGTVRARDGRVLLGPLSGRKCVFYEVVVEERESSGKNHYWRERIRDVDQVDFDVEDETGIAHVSTRDMKQLATTDSQQDSGFLDDATPALEEYLKRHDTTSVGFLFNKNMRYREGVFEVGERVVVLGQVALEDDATGQVADGSYRGTPKKPFLEAPPGGSLVVSDERDSTGDG